MKNINDYAMDILTKNGCDCYTYGGEQSAHLLDDLKEAYPDGMEYGYGYVEVANAILAISKPEPIIRKEYRVVYDTDSVCDGYDMDSYETAKESALDILAEWAVQERATWASDTPTDEERERWDYMIYNCGAWVEKYNKITDEYQFEWEPSDLDVQCIGWLLYEEE